MRVSTKKFRPEDHLQYQVAQFLKIQYKHVLFCHVANERQAKPQYMAKLKSLGVQSGVPDVLIFNPVGQFIGLAIELKSKRGVMQDTQTYWLDALKARGWQTVVCRTLDEVVNVLKEYFKNE